MVSADVDEIRRQCHGCGGVVSATRDQIYPYSLVDLRSIVCMNCGLEVRVYKRYRRRIHATAHEDLRPNIIAIHKDIYDWWRWRCTGTHAVIDVRGVDHDTKPRTWEECMWDAEIHAYHFHGVNL